MVSSSAISKQEIIPTVFVLDIHTQIYLKQDLLPPGFDSPVGGKPHPFKTDDLV